MKQAHIAIKLLIVWLLVAIAASGQRPNLKKDVRDTLRPNHGGTGSSTAPTEGQILVGQADGTYKAVTISGDCAVTSAGVVSCVAAGTVTNNSTLASGYTAYVNANYGATQGYTDTNTRYVSPSGSDTTGTGLAANPWKTMDKATSVVSGCYKVLLMPGAYTMASGRTAKIVNDGTSGCHTVFMAMSYGSVFLETPENYANDPSIWINANYVDLVGFDINNPKGGNYPLTTSRHCEMLLVLWKSVRRQTRSRLARSTPFRTSMRSSRTMLPA